MATSDDPLRDVRTEYRHLDLRQVLHSSPDVLIAVTPAAVDCLRRLGIATVFDLATSWVFANAASLDRAGDDQGHLFRRAGAVTSDVVNPANAAGVAVEELRTHSVSVLAGIGDTFEPVVRERLGVATVQELAHWPAFVAAAAILDAVFFPEQDAGYDPEAPADLVPRNGEYPTERVSYTTLLFDEVAGGGAGATEDILSPNFTPVDVYESTAHDWGFQKVAFGTLLTFTQSWYVDGVTLGQLLHSAALAPGESTRVAVIDWSRRSRAGQTETDQQAEDLTNDTSQNRSISEVTSAVAREAQGGFSSSQQHGQSPQRGTASGGSQSGGGGLGDAVVGLVSGGLSAAKSVIDHVLPF